MTKSACHRITKRPVSQVSHVVVARQAGRIVLVLVRGVSQPEGQISFEEFLYGHVMRTVT